jgi:hypothetical protein
MEPELDSPDFVQGNGKLPVACLDFDIFLHERHAHDAAVTEANLGEMGTRGRRG